MRDLAEPPEFLREALAGEPSALAAVTDLALLLTPAARADPSRLLAAVATPPLRYAPFYDRVGALWDLPESDVDAILTRAADPRAFRKPGLPGLTLIDIEGGPKIHGARATLARFAGGMRFPAHFHPGPEALLVLEGSYRDSTGRHVGPGDLHRMLPGSAHSFRVDRGHVCIAASVQFGFEFTGAFMRLLSKLFG